LDQIELEEALGADSVEFYQEPPIEGTVAEPAMIAAFVTLGGMAIGALAIWLSKARHKEVLKQSLTVQTPDGATVKWNIKVTASSEAEAQAEIVAQLNTLFGAMGTFGGS
jgi:hypothetical protein